METLNRTSLWWKDWGEEGENSKAYSNICTQERIVLDYLLTISLHFILILK